MKKLLIDNRWGKTGGIGVFAEEINKICKYKNAALSGKPYSPIDCLKTAIKSYTFKDTVIFYPGYIPPLFSKCPYVFTIHDLNHLDRPDNSSLLKRIFYGVVIKRACKKASFIFTVSEFSRERIINWSGVNPEKVINVGNGVSELFNPCVKGDYYPFEYILCVSNRKAHKNEFRTIEAFFKANLSSAISLVFTGKPSQEIEKFLKEKKFYDRVKFTGYVDEDELPSLYKGARALVFVSLYEGFGLPVVEAMATGTPVVTSDTTSLTEVAGNAALKVDPENVDEIALALNAIVTNDSLRAKLIEDGFVQAKKFSWEKVANRVNEYLIKS